jgi:spore coat polysaccharide biosynthesis protein SpsF
MKIGAIIQARMGSSRLPGKVMTKIMNRTVLEHVVERVRQSKLINEIIVATSTLDQDNILKQEAIRINANVFLGSEENVLSRYYYAAKMFNLDIIVRITSDCPLIDPIILDELLKTYLNSDYDIVSNAGPNKIDRTFPRGLDAEVFSFEVLEETFLNAKQKHHIEHVTPYIYENKSKVYYYKNEIDYSKYRLTLDTKEDYILIKKIYETLYKENMFFYLNEIIELLKSDESLFLINSHIEQKKIK